jgi:hypothetical protein
MIGARGHCRFVHGLVVTSVLFNEMLQCGSNVRVLLFLCESSRPARVQANLNVYAMVLFSREEKKNL